LGDLENIISLTVVISVFGLVLAGWLVLIFVWAFRKSVRTEKVERRLDMSGSQDKKEERVLRLWYEGKEATTTVARDKHHFTFHQYMEEIHQNAGFTTPWQTILMSLLGIMLLLFVVVLVLSGSFLGAIASFLSVPIILWIYIKQRINKQQTLFERQLLNAIGLASRSLRAGHPLTGAFRFISEEISPPVGEVFGSICEQQALGVSLEIAIRKATENCGSEDMKMFATSVVMQLRSGGNLADMMERLAMVIRDRIRLHRRVRILTAQTQFSKRVLLALPIIVFAAINSLAPDYVLPLYTTPIGKVLGIVALAGLGSGWWLMNRLARISY